MALRRHRHRLLRLGYPSVNAARRAMAVTAVSFLVGCGLLYTEAIQRQQRRQLLMKATLESELREQAQELAVRTTHWAADYADHVHHEAHGRANKPEAFRAFWASRPGPPSSNIQALLLTADGQRLAWSPLRKGLPAQPMQPLGTKALQAIHAAELPRLVTLPSGQPVLTGSARTKLADGAVAWLVLLESIEPIATNMEKVFQLAGADSADDRSINITSHSHADRQERDEAHKTPSALSRLLLTSGKHVEIAEPAGLGALDLDLYFPTAPDARLELLRGTLALLLGTGLVFAAISSQRTRSSLEQRRNRLAALKLQRQEQHRSRERRKQDSLTGLLSVEGLVIKLQQQRQQYPHFHHAVVVIDLDRFSLINGSLGRSGGDRVLQRMGQRLLESLPPTSLVAREQSDRFAVTLLGVSEAALKTEIETLSHQLSRFELDEETPAVVLTARCGVRQLRADDTALPEAIYQAGFACDLAKRQHTRLEIYGADPSSENHFLQLQVMHQQLNQAISHGTLLAYGQPAWQPTAQSWQASYVEVLCRMVDPEGGADYWHERFVEAAAFWGTDSLLDQAMLELVAQELVALRQRHGGTLPAILTAVNITAASLNDSSFVPRLQALLERHELPPERIAIEITEQAAIENLKMASTQLGWLRRLGITVVLDDFGAGTTSLRYLQDLPLDVVKLDRGFVTNLAADKTSTSYQCSRSVVQFLMQLSRQLQFEVIAEGVETEAMLEELKHLGVRWMQGYLLARPAPFATLDLSASIPLQRV